jgi:hypothetical protein
MPACPKDKEAYLCDFAGKISGPSGFSTSNFSEARACMMYTSHKG